MKTWIVVTGTPSDGFIHYGPFNNFSDAEALMFSCDESAWVVELLEPEE